MLKMQDFYARLVSDEEPQNTYLHTLTGLTKASLEEMLDVPSNWYWTDWAEDPE
jgi:hypothetical protein